ncbi:MAG: PAC2 family protein, partial [Dehalococcoidia bacterium]|nr:PAC2 family protein [Dehalococcoidia bacterium]
METGLFELYGTPRLTDPSLIVGWGTHDVGGVGARVIDFLNEHLDAEDVAEIKPRAFFSLGGATFKDDLVQVPESKFRACPRANLLTFKSAEPEHEWHGFLTAILDLARDSFGVKDLYTVGGTVSMLAHTTPRHLLTVFNDPEFQSRLRDYGLEDMTWEGPPAMSSCLLWAAQRAGVPGVSLWAQVPFYLASAEDPRAASLVLSFLDRRFNLGLDLRPLDEEAG